MVGEYFVGVMIFSGGGRSPAPLVPVQVPDQKEAQKMSDYNKAGEQLARIAVEKWDQRETILEVFDERRWANWLFQASWDSLAKLTVVDIREILLSAAEYLDGNLWSQLYLASPLMVFPTYDQPKMQKRLNELSTQWAKSDESPFHKGAKMRRTGAEQDLEWNEVLTLINAFKILEKAPTHTTYKMYDRNKTPAFSDTAGLSRLSNLVDSYILTPSGQWSVVYAQDSLLTPKLVQGGARFAGFDVTFESKSGDWENLASCLTIREAMRHAFVVAQGRTYLIPRYGTLSVLTASS
jgi:hypothetical protein